MPVRIVVLPFFTDSVLPDTTVGTEPLGVDGNIKTPFFIESSVIVPMLVVLRKTVSCVPAARLTLVTSTTKCLVAVLAAVVEKYEATPCGVTLAIGDPERFATRIG